VSHPIVNKLVGAGLHTLGRAVESAVDSVLEDVEHAAELAHREIRAARVRGRRFVEERARRKDRP
jgi:hypothetical protein